MAKQKKSDFKKSFEELKTIADWFEKQEEVDIEEGLLKAKKGAELIKECRKKLGDIENEFETIKQELE